MRVCYCWLPFPKRGSYTNHIALTMPALPALIDFLPQPCSDCLSYICIVSKYKDYTFDYDDMAGYLHYIQLQISIGPSEGSWRSKEHIFKIKGHWFIEFSPKNQAIRPVSKRVVFVFSFFVHYLPQEVVCFLAKKKGWLMWYDGIQFGEVHGINKFA